MRAISNLKVVVPAAEAETTAVIKWAAGGLGIRTLATVTRPNDLANRPLQPLE